MRKLDPDRERAIIDAYQAWDMSTTAEQLAFSLGISRQTLYDVIHRNGIPLKGRAPRRLSAKPKPRTSEDEQLARVVMDLLGGQVARETLASLAAHRLALANLVAAVTNYLDSDNPDTQRVLASTLNVARELQALGIAGQPEPLDRRDE